MTDASPHQPQLSPPHPRPVAALIARHALRERLITLLARRWPHEAPPSLVCIDLGPSRPRDDVVRHLCAGVRARDLVTLLGVGWYVVLAEKTEHVAAVALASRLATLHSAPVGTATGIPGERAEALLERACAACEGWLLDNGTPPLRDSPH